MVLFGNFTVFVSIVFVLSLNFEYVYSNGNVGCIYSQNLCSKKEWCFDDFAFGRCLIRQQHNGEWKYRFYFDAHQLERIRKELFHLFDDGFQWEHAFTQCRLQAMLSAIRFGVDFDEKVCVYLKDDRSIQEILKSELPTTDQNDPYNPSAEILRSSITGDQNDPIDAKYYQYTDPDQSLDEIPAQMMRRRSLSSYDYYDDPNWLGPYNDQPPRGLNLYDLEYLSNTFSNIEKKIPRGFHPKARESQLKQALDNSNIPDYVYVVFANVLDTWKQGEHIIRTIANLLNVEPQAFTYGRVDRNQVTFKVLLPNSRDWNATEIARRIRSIRDDLTRISGVVVIATGVGDRNTMLKSIVEGDDLTPPDVVQTLDGDDHFKAIYFLIGGVVLAVFMAIAVLLVIRRVIRIRDKSTNLGEAVATASAKSSTNRRSTRITSLSRDGNEALHSPSSRSSTSSWTEEPFLNNMDISTGHMVLNYMEDHLRNRDRLEQEWLALCAYAAEPCAMKAALRKSNIDKNRCADLLPYDHSRVVLNDLVNASASDYINASTITDHDPRNPAYIATQGPLAATVSDFWQMIWEQGVVVIVMLTRLTDVDGTELCHRYWPEEGAHVYHNYEVHLISEHIWCEEYLVRSFYLKNTRTGETRTVTQFHFQSWPATGVPTTTRALLEFRRKVNKSYRGRSCPVVVHCNDGVGRTGTYCLIDLVLSRLSKGTKEIDIAATLEHLRDQRMRMVANRAQFEFVLTAVADEVHAILKALPSTSGAAAASVTNVTAEGAANSGSGE